MKLLILSEYYPPAGMGGGEMSAASLARALADLGHEVTVLTSAIPELPSSECTGGVRILRHLQTGAATGVYGLWHRFVSLPRSIRRVMHGILAREQFDAAHCPNISSGVLARVAEPLLRRKRIPLNLTLNGHTLLCPKGDYLYRGRQACSGRGFLKCCRCMAASTYWGKLRPPLALRWNPLVLFVAYLHFLWRHVVLFRAQWLVCYSGYMERLLQREGVPTSRLKQIPSLTPSFARRFLRKRRSPFVVLFLGSLEFLKGPDLLIDALAQTPESVELWIAGDGPEREQLERRATDLGLASRVRFLGRVPNPELKRYFDAAGVVALPSRLPEAFSRICLESMASGVPLIATEVGANVDGVVNGVTGFLVDPKPSAFSRAFAELAKHPSLVSRMGKNAYRRYVREFSRRVVLSRLRQLYPLPGNP